MLPFSLRSSLSHLHLPPCLSINLSTCSGPWGGGALRLFIRSLFPLLPVWRWIIWTLTRILHLTGSCYLLPAFVWKRSLWSSGKFLRSAKKFCWLEEHHRGGTLGRACDQTPSSPPVPPSRCLSVFTRKRSKFSSSSSFTVVFVFLFLHFLLLLMLGWTHALMC